MIVITKDAIIMKTKPKNKKIRFQQWDLDNRKSMTTKDLIISKDQPLEEFEKVEHTDDDLSNLSFLITMA